MSRVTFDRTGGRRDEKARTAPPIVNEVLGSTGRPLEPVVRGEMEARFGHDFSEVRVHSDPRAAESAHAVDARAYTVGSEIVLGTGGRGRDTLVHELAHVVQQSGAERVSGPIGLGDAGGRLEHEAEQAAAGTTVAGTLGASPPAVARQPAGAGQTADERIEEAQRRAAAQFDWLLAYPPPAMDDDAPMLISWAERSAERFHDPSTTDSARGYIAVGLMKVYTELKEFEARAKRDPDGALIYSSFGRDVPWSGDRPHSVDELPLFAPESVERWRRVADFASADEEAEEAPRGRRRPPPRKPVKVTSPIGREVEITRLPNTISFPKGKDMSAASDEGQRDLIWLYVASTHPGLSGDQISWVVSRLGLFKVDGSRRLVSSWIDDFEAAKPGDRIKLTADPAFEQDLTTALLEVPSERDLLLEGYRRGVLDARGGLVLAYGTLAVGSLAFGGAAGIGYLGSLGGEVAMSGIAAGGGTFLGGETASFGSFAAAGGRFVATDLYLNAGAYFQSGMLYGGAVLSGMGFGEQALRIRSEGWHNWEIGEAASNLLPLAEGALPYLGGGRRAPAPTGPVDDPDLGTPPGAAGPSRPEFARTARPDELARTARPDELARTASPDELGRTARPGDLARTAGPGELAETVPPAALAPTVPALPVQTPGRGPGGTIVGPPPAPVQVPAPQPSMQPAPPTPPTPPAPAPAAPRGLPPGVTAVSPDEAIAEFQRDPKSIFHAQTTDWFEQGIAGEWAFQQGPRRAVGVPRLTLEPGELPVAVRAGGRVIVDAERWPADRRGAIGLPQPPSQTVGTAPPPPMAPGPAAAPRRMPPSTPVLPDEVIQQYQRDPRSVLGHPMTRAFQETLRLEGFEGDDFPVAVRSGDFVIVDVESWPDALRAAIGLPPRGQTQ
jgi:uncharacterized protein DUF4157